MANVKRDDYITQSYLYFLTAMILSIATFILGGGYLAFYHEVIDLPKTALKLGAIEAALVFSTYVCWRLYIADLRLLESKNKSMKKKSANIDTRGINPP